MAVALLFDHNLSPRLVTMMADIFPGSAHVFPLGMDTMPDRDVWLYAGTHGYTIVSKDADFSDLSLLLGLPPKLVWLRIGNCTTAEIAALLRSHQTEIEEMVSDSASGILALS